VNQGGDTGHDDYGLPRVDIQIPDDARELDRDVQAYHRELRALRRHERSLRWRAPLRRSGMIVPLIAGCLVLAMVAGMVLTMFSANPYISGISGQRPQGPPAHSGSAAGDRLRSSSAAPSATGNPSGGPATGARTRLPAGRISVAGQLLPLSTVASAALAIIPANCGCASQIKRLVYQAIAAGIPVYLVGKRGTRAQLERLVPPEATGTAYINIAIDADNALNATYAARNLTVILVDQQRKVMSVAPLQPRFELRSALKQLGSPVH
jgi:hypothetical protein